MMSVQVTQRSPWFCRTQKQVLPPSRTKGTMFLLQSACSYQIEITAQFPSKDPTIVSLVERRGRTNNGECCGRISRNALLT